MFWLKRNIKYFEPTSDEADGKIMKFSNFIQNVERLHR